MATGGINLEPKESTQSSGRTLNQLCELPSFGVFKPLAAHLPLASFRDAFCRILIVVAQIRLNLSHHTQFPKRLSNSFSQPTQSLRFHIPLSYSSPTKS